MQFDENLQAVSSRYAKQRKEGHIGVMEVHLVQHGAFAAMRKAMAESTFGQFKTPRVLRINSCVEILKQRELKSSASE